MLGVILPRPVLEVEKRASPDANEVGTVAAFTPRRKRNWTEVKGSISVICLGRSLSQLSCQCLYICGIVILNSFFYRHAGTVNLGKA